jgi:hypothetical protein
MHSFKISYYTLIGCFEDGIDYSGGEIAATISISSDKCQKMCQSIPICNYWTWVKPGSTQSEKYCYLKTRVERRRKESDGKKTVSGPKYCHGRYFC